MSECSVPDSVLLDEGGERLLWSFEVDEHLDLWDGSETYANQTRSRRASKGALDAFLQITSAVAVKAFAQRYGPLGLCGQHLLPASHNESCQPGRLPGRGQVHWEPVSRWLEFVGAASAMLHLTVDVRKDRAGEEKDWLDAARLFEHPDLPDDILQVMVSLFSGGPTAAREGISFLAYRWLEMGDVRPMVNWEDGEPKLELAAAMLKPPLFRVLASQLTLAVAGANEMAQCSGCSVLYLREDRRPRKKERNFCPTCRKSSIPTKLRQRVHRAKNP